MSDTAKNQSKRHVRYFISYSHRDFESRTEGPKLVEFKDLIMTKMKLSPGFVFEPWDDFQILPGDRWREQIDSHLSECDFGLVIVSENLLSSDFITKVELPIFIEGERPFVPLAFGALDFSRDMQGLQDHQVFRLRRPGEEPRALAQCNTPQLKNEFATELIHQIEKKLRRQSGSASAVSSAPASIASSPPSTRSQDDLEAILKNVFKQEFDRIRAEFEKNKELRDLVINAFKIPEGPSDLISLQLMVVFYDNFLNSIGKYSQLSQDCDDRDGFDRLVASFMYLAMDADFARGLRDKKDAGVMEIPEKAKHGITLLLKWTHSLSPLRLDDFKKSRPMNSPECLPNQRFDDIRNNLLKKFGISSNEVDADVRLAERLTEEKAFGTPCFQTLSQDEKETLQRIKADRSPLKDLLLMIVTEGHSIDPSRANFDRQFESHLNHLLAVLDPEKA